MTILFAAVGENPNVSPAAEAWDEFMNEQRPANRLYQIKPFSLDGPAMIYQPY